MFNYRFRRLRSLSWEAASTLSVTAVFAAVGVEAFSAGTFFEVCFFVAAFSAAAFVVASVVTAAAAVTVAAVAAVAVVDASLDVAVITVVVAAAGVEAFSAAAFLVFVCFCVAAFSAAFCSLSVSFPCLLKHTLTINRTTHKTQKLIFITAKIACKRIPVKLC